MSYYTATAYVDVDDGVYPGMQVTVSIPQEQAENVVILKEAALSFDAANSAYVWMYNDAGELERVDVEVGVSNGNYVEIVSGLSDGDEVYVEVEQEASSSGGLLAGLFGSQQMNAPGGGDFGGGGMPGGGDFDFSGMPSDFSGGGMPGGELSKRIDDAFGSFEAFKEQFKTAAVTQFGSGWAWLAVVARDLYRRA